jgi:lipopolysaccharide/colanic/teichoic acid biosynthesis glycosyltransferase
MNKYNKRSFISFTQIFIDVVCILISFFVAIFLSYKNNYNDDINSNIWFIVLFTTFYVCAMLISNMYNLTTFVYYDRLLRRILLSSIFSYIFCYYMLTSIVPPESGNKQFSLIFLLVVLLVLPSYRIISHEVHKSSKSRWHNRVLLIGNGENIKEYMYYLNKTSFNLNILGYIPTEVNEEISDYKNMGNLSDLNTILTESAVDEIVFAIHYSKIKEMEKYIFICEERGLIVRMAMDFNEMNSSRNYIHSIGTLPMLTFHNTPQNGLGKIVKRIFDIVITIIGLIILVILTIPIILIKLFSSGSSLFHTFDFITINGRKYKLIKYNTEKHDWINNFLVKSGIRDLPQFINVLKGEMSIVGTHPISLAELNDLSDHGQQRLTMKPGMTGMWWINRHKHLNKKDQVKEIDNRYIDNWSLTGDLIIFLETIFMLFHNKVRKHKVSSSDK